MDRAFVANAYYLSLFVSCLLFVTHKVEGRYKGWGQPDPEQTPAWHTAWPWIILSHAPFHSWGKALATTAIYFGVFALVMLGVHPILTRWVQGGSGWGAGVAILVFSFGWLNWLVFEIHHVRGAVQRQRITRGLVFSLVSIVWGYLIYLPAAAITLGAMWGLAIQGSP